MFIDINKFVMEALAIVGFVASIVQLVDTAAKLSIHLYSFSSTLGEAKEDINAIALEISLFANTLDQLSTLFEKDDAQYSEAVLQNTNNVIRSCRDLFSRYESLLNHLTHPGDQEIGMPPHVVLSKTGRVKWAFKQKRVEVLRRRLAALQTNLLTMLHTLTLSELQSIRSIVSKEPRGQAAMKEQILRSYIVANRSSVSSLEEAEKQAELAEDELSLVKLQDEDIERLLLQSDDTGKFPSPRLKRDSTWLLAAMPDMPTSSQTSDEVSTKSEDENSPQYESISVVQGFISRYSIVFGNSVEQPHESDMMFTFKESPYGNQYEQMGSKGKGLDHLVKFKSRESSTSDADHENTRRLVPTAAKSVPKKEHPQPPVLDQMKSERRECLHSRDFGPESILDPESPCKLLDFESFDFYKDIRIVQQDQDFLDEVSAIEQWFRVLSSNERLAGFRGLLHQMNQSEPQSTYLSAMLRDWHNTKWLSHLDLVRFQRMEKDRRQAFLDKDFYEELRAIRRWFKVLDDAERVAAFVAFLIQGTSSQVAFLCCYEASHIISLI